jgi:two-component system chemotaxis response regulator CheY
MNLTILHVEDSRVVAQAVRDTLEGEGWRVEMCADGYAALNRLASATRYHLLILDNGLPNVSGLELARYARKLPRYRKTPIIMFSASDLRDEARAAGVDLFLKKPDDTPKLVDAVRRLTAG